MHSGVWLVLTPLLLSHQIVLWTGTSICIAVCALRFGIRNLTFRRLFPEDYLMLASLIILIALAAVLQHYLGDFYLVLAIMNRRALPGPDFPTRTESAMRGTGIALVLSTVGIWAIELSFLTFFRRFGAQIRAYMAAWWIACFLVVATAVVQIGIIPYSCLFTSWTSLLTRCETDASLTLIYDSYKASIALDVISDVVIVCFPTLIAWRTKITMRQKIFLAGIFLLMGLTIAVTITRGFIFEDAYKSVNDFDRKVINMAWMLFWFMIQYFVYRKRDELARRQRAAQGSPAAAVSRQCRNRWFRLHGSVLQTLADLEATDIDQDCSQLLEHQPPSGTPSGKLTAEFSSWSATDTYKRSFSHYETLHSSHTANSSSL
ncbi:hypothetical protein PG991_013470 [Apiospora marii]|uniref:Rhodopsin domain-containing protein n=1 Tax=Apiospora marii TaxID=335849 RepID=A0ABR1R6F3_9PEZI